MQEWAPGTVYVGGRRKTVTEIRRLVRARHNVENLAAHRISWREVQEIVDGNDWVLDVHPEYLSQRRMIGPTRSGRLLTIVLDPTDDPAVWRPVTGWRSEADEIACHQEETTWTG